VDLIASAFDVEQLVVFVAADRPRTEIVGSSESRSETTEPPRTFLRNLMSDFFVRRIAKIPSLAR